MYSTMVLKKVWIPVSSSTVMAASVFAASKENKGDQEKKELVRARELPVYRQVEEKTEQKDSDQPKQESTLHSTVRQVREGLSSIYSQVNEVSDKFNNIIETAKAHSSSTIQILREEENFPHRCGAITAGGLLGYIIAIRRGWFKRIIYTATGATAIAAICYPEEAREYSSEGFRQTKKYIVIAYHFINGVFRDYVGVQLPSLPGPLLIGNSNDSSAVPTSAALMPPPASSPSHISAGPIPLPPIDQPSSVSDFKTKQG